MKFLPSSLRLLALPALALLGVSCGSKDDVAANPYATNPYYGPQSYGNTGQTSDNSYVAPAPDYANSGYTAPAPAPSYTAPAPAPAPAPTYASGGTSHRVSPGDTLFSLSRRYGTTVTAIKSANGLNSDLIRIGETLSIPSA